MPIADAGGFVIGASNALEVSAREKIPVGTAAARPEHAETVDAVCDEIT